MQPISFVFTEGPKWQNLYIVHLSKSPLGLFSQQQNPNVTSRMYRFTTDQQGNSVIKRPDFIPRVWVV